MVPVSVPWVMTVNEKLLLTAVPLVILMGPLTAAWGTAAVICTLLQLVGVPRMALNASWLSPCALPKFVPFMVTTVPRGAAGGSTAVTFGGGVTMKPTAAL